MPIRINLLAESQALEDLRRRDPVKRAILVGACIGVVMLGWSGWLQAKAFKQKLAVNALQARIQGRTNEYQVVMENRKKLDNVNQKLAALHRLTSARLLNANILDALQHTIVDNVQLVRLKTLHTPPPMKTRPRPIRSGIRLRPSLRPLPKKSRSPSRPGTAVRILATR
jgi:Tfp pilus assembly protein PilN